MDVIALIPAAGSGERLGLEMPKALVPIGGKTIIEKTLDTVLRVEQISHVFVAAPPEYVETVEKLVTAPKVMVFAGGKTRQESVGIGLECIGRMLPTRSEDCLVLVHDAARCFVTTTLIERCIDAGKKYGAVSAAIAAVDSIKQINDAGMVVRSLDRSTLVVVQTPQVFSYALLKKAHQQAQQVGMSQAATDDASLVESHMPVKIVWGESRNIKVTTPEDLRVAMNIVTEP